MSRKKSSPARSMFTKDRLLSAGPAAALMAALLVMMAGSAGAQTFGTYTTAAIAPEGEGGAFMSAGKDQFRTGLYGRFQMSHRTDIGFQGGFDRFKGVNSYGLGVDVKMYVIGEGSDIPLDMAMDISLGHLRSEHTGSTILGVAFLASGRLQADTQFPIDPYMSVGFYNTIFQRESTCDGPAPPDYCGNNDSSNTDVVFRAGARLYLDSERQILAEIKVDGDVSVGAAFNIIF